MDQEEMMPNGSHLSNASCDAGDAVAYGTAPASATVLDIYARGVFLCGDFTTDVEDTDTSTFDATLEGDAQKRYLQHVTCLRFTKDDAVRGAVIITSLTSSAYFMYSSMPDPGSFCMCKPELTFCCNSLQRVLIEAMILASLARCKARSL